MAIPKQMLEDLEVMSGAISAYYIPPQRNRAGATHLCVREGAGKERLVTIARLKKLISGKLISCSDDGKQVRIVLLVRGYRELGKTAPR